MLLSLALQCQQSLGKSYCWDVVLDSVNRAHIDKNIFWNQIHENKTFIQLFVIFFLILMVILKNSYLKKYIQYSITKNSLKNLENAYHYYRKRTCKFWYFWSKTSYSSLDAFLKMSKTASPQKLFPSDYMKPIESILCMVMAKVSSE